MKSTPVRRLHCLLICLMFWGCSSPAHSESAAEWHLAKAESGIRIYHQGVEGSPFKRYRGVMTAETTLGALVALVGDPEGYPAWVETCAYGRVVERVGPREMIIHTINSAPWPVMDRDSVVDVRTEQETGGAVFMRLKGVPDHIPRKADLVRVETIEGFWRFTPLGEGRVEVVYQVYSDPGGDLPAWLVNAIATSRPLRTLKQMRTMLRRPEYSGATYDFIRESPE